MGKSFKDILKLSSATMGSRILGLVRDSATMAYIGIGAVSSAYTFAFTLPNLFRRLLGEGALTSAMIPTLTHAKENGGNTEAFEFLNKIITRTAIVFLSIVLLGIFLSLTLLLTDFANTERFELSAIYSAILMPYMFLICMAAVFTAALNVSGSFGIPAITPAILNIMIILGTFTGAYLFGKDAKAIAYCMCIAWLIGGFLQMAIPALYLRKFGWRFRPDFKKSDALSELWRLFIPAFIGAAVIQINIFASKIMALFISDSALPSLYVSSRLLELPLGVFAIAIATVYFPKLSALSATNDTNAYRKAYKVGLVVTMAISIPSTFGLIALSKDILSMLFQWGIFDAKDVNICVPVMITAVLGLPFFALATFATKGFHSVKDTKIPMRASYISFVINIVFSIILMFKFDAVGLAGANVISAVVQSIFLVVMLRKKFGSFKAFGEIFKILLASVIMALVIIMGISQTKNFFDGRELSVINCCLFIPIGVFIYAISLKLLKFEELNTLSQAFFRKFKK